MRMSTTVSPFTKLALAKMLARRRVLQRPETLSSGSQEDINDPSLGSEDYLKLGNSVQDLSGYLGIEPAPKPQSIRRTMETEGLSGDTVECDEAIAPNEAPSEPHPPLKLQARLSLPNNVDYTILRQEVELTLDSGEGGETVHAIELHQLMGVVAFITSVTQGQAVGLEDKNETGQELRSLQDESGTKDEDKSGKGAVVKNKRSFLCPDCPKVFTARNKLVIHRRQHDPEPANRRPFQCDKCGKTFTRRDNLATHMNLGHPWLTTVEFECPLCDEGFAVKSDMNEHISSIHLRIRHPCPHPGCEKVFKWRWKLERHQVKEHSEVEEPTTATTP